MAIANPISAADIAAVLEKLTQGWKPAPGVAPETLTAARQAIAGSVVAGKSLNEIHAIVNPTESKPAFNPKLTAELLDIASGVIARKPEKTVAVIRSAWSATKMNPLGRPDWARGAQILTTYGPFQDALGVDNWVDLILFTYSIPFAFGTAATPFAVLPYHGFLFPPPAPTSLSLGSGSSWFEANLLAPGAQAGSFAGFLIANGAVTCSAAMSYDASGVYVAPAGSTITVTATLVAAAAPIPSGDPGADAAAARFTPPANIKLVFTQTNVRFEQIDDAELTVYGSTVKLHWNKGAAIAPVPEQPLLVIPCDGSPNSFEFEVVDSDLMNVSGSAPVALAGWGLQVTTAAINSLPEAANAGAGVLVLGAGSDVINDVATSPVAAEHVLLEVTTGGIYAVFFGKAALRGRVYSLWAQAAPSKLRSTVEFRALPQFEFVYWATPVQELLYATGTVKAFLDRPIDAAGARFAFDSPGFLTIVETKTSKRIGILGTSQFSVSEERSIALENAVLGVDAPSLFVLYGTLDGVSVQDCSAGFYFECRWLLPTLPDPYAANFDLSVIPPEQNGGMQAILVARNQWAGGSAKPVLSFELLPSPNQSTSTGTPFSAVLEVQGDVLAASRRGAGAALLDLSTAVDLFGVAVFPELAELIASSRRREDLTGSSTPAPPLALTGMSLALNGALAASFALPQFSWEPMESTAPGETGPLYCFPPSDGLPLLLNAPNEQQLVPFSPKPLLMNNIRNVAEGEWFAAAFSLPFGLDAVVVQPNSLMQSAKGMESALTAGGGHFGLNRAEFPASFVPDPKGPVETVAGAFQLSISPEHAEELNATFPGWMDLDSVRDSSMPGLKYGDAVMGSDIATIFRNEFGRGGATECVPLRRIDFSGYGASIYSEWIDEPAAPASIIKAQFEANRGRTAYEVIKAYSVILPYYVKAVRTVTMERQNAGWVHRGDTGWQPASAGLFQYALPVWAGRVHPGALAGVYNVRNIREMDDAPVSVANPGDATKPFLFKKVLFDADLGIAPGLSAGAGTFKAPVAGVTNPPPLVSSRDIAGYLQIQPEAEPDPSVVDGLLAQTGPLSATFSAQIEAGASGGAPGTRLRCTAFQTGMIREGTAGPVPALGTELMGAPQIPRGGGWSMGQRRFSDAAPSALPNDFPVPLVQPAGTTSTWYFADVGDILQLAQPLTYYSLMHSTGTNKVLFESPQVPVAPTVPGLQFPKPSGPPKPGGAPANSGSPNLGDLASILNSTGLFPDIANAISLMQGAMEQINTIAQGFHYTKTYPGPGDPPLPKTTLIDLSVLSIDLAYADTTTNKPGALTYTVDSSASPSWSLSVGPVSFEVNVPAFGSDPVLTIVGGFYADEHTKAGLTGLNVHMGSALSIIQGVFSKLQYLAQFLPGGVGANLNVTVADGVIDVSDTFTIGDLPLGLGDLTDISLDLGLHVQISPLSVNFGVGIGGPNNPFNWIVSPLAGNGMMNFGVAEKVPSFTIQAGIGLGLAIDLGIASGSASITIAVQLNVTGNSVTLMAILTGQASVDVLDGLASASLTLSAALGFSLNPLIPPVSISGGEITLGPETVTMIASCSVGIHLTVCWVVSVSWDGSWQFSQSITTPKLTIAA